MDVSGPDDENNVDLETVKICVAQCEFALTEDEFYGACVYSRAQQTIIGQRQTIAYIKQVGNDRDIEDIERYDNKNSDSVMWNTAALRH